MRLLLAALLVALPGLAEAQTVVSTVPTGMPGPPAPSIGLPLAPIGLPLADISLPLAPIGTPPQFTVTRTTPTRTTPDAGRRREPRQRGPQHKGRPGTSVVYVVPAYGWGLPGYPVASPTPEQVPEDAAPTGTLWLDIEPRGVGEVYIDGYLAGTTMEVRGSMELDAGVHRVEIHAGGYQPIGVGVRIEAGGVVTLRRALQPLATPAEPPVAASASQQSLAAHAVPIARKPFYYIAGCYLGDVPPKDAGLAPTCDPNKMVVIQP